MTHTHSTHAVAFAQANLDIRSWAPPTPTPSRAGLLHPPAERRRGVRGTKSWNTGRAIVDLVKTDDNASGPYQVRWPSTTARPLGCQRRKSLEHAIICEAVARTAMLTLQLNPRLRRRHTCWTGTSPASTARALTTATESRPCARSSSVARPVATPAVRNRAFAASTRSERHEQRHAAQPLPRRRHPRHRRPGRATGRPARRRPCPAGRRQPAAPARRCSLAAARATAGPAARRRSPTAGPSRPALIWSQVLSRLSG